MQREDGRCEGEYRQLVNSRVAELVIAALWDRAPSGRWPAQVSLSWSTGRTEQVRIEVTALGERDYYRVDQIVVGSSNYSWPTAIIAKTHLMPRDVGIVAYYEGPRRTYIPITTDRTSGSTGAYHLVLFSSADVSELSLGVTRSETGETVIGKTYKSPSIGSFLANRAIDLELPALGRGTYKVAISALTPGTRAVGALVLDVQLP
jgi:hypothetical protein